MSKPTVRPRSETIEAARSGSSTRTGLTPRSRRMADDRPASSGDKQRDDLGCQLGDLLAVFRVEPGDAEHFQIGASEADPGAGPDHPLQQSSHAIVAAFVAAQIGPEGRLWRLHRSAADRITGARPTAGQAEIASLAFPGAHHHGRQRNHDEPVFDGHAPPDRVTPARLATEDRGHPSLPRTSGRWSAQREQSGLWYSLPAISALPSSASIGRPHWAQQGGLVGRLRRARPRRSVRRCARERPLHPKHPQHPKHGPWNPRLSCASCVSFQRDRMRHHPKRRAATRSTRRRLAPVPGRRCAWFRMPAPHPQHRQPRLTARFQAAVSEFRLFRMHQSSRRQGTAATPARSRPGSSRAWSCRRP